MIITNPPQAASADELAAIQSHVSSDSTLPLAPIDDFLFKFSKISHLSLVCSHFLSLFELATATGMLAV